MLIRPLSFLFLVSGLIVGPILLRAIALSGLDLGVVIPSSGLSLPPIVYAFYVGCLFAFWLGFLFVLRDRVLEPAPPTQELFDWNWGPKFVPASFLAMVGLTLTSVGVAVLLVSLEAPWDYLREFWSLAVRWEASPALRYQPSSFVRSEQLPGIVRMFNVAVPAAFILCLVIWRRLLPRFGEAKKFYLILAIVYVAVLFRTVVVQDRAALSFLSLILGIQMFGTLVKKGLSGLLAIFSLGSILALFFVLITVIRGIPGGVLGSLVVYSDLGVTNATLAFSSDFSWTYGFSTILHPAKEVAEFFGYGALVPTPNVPFLRNPAGSLVTYAYYDFGLAGILVFFILGAVGGVTFRKASESLYWYLAHLWFLYAILSIWVVPVFRAVSFWVGVLLSLVTLLGLLYSRKVWRVYRLA